jgi:hypothetical protein
LDDSLAGTASFPELEASLKEAGRGTSLPLVGLMISWFSKPVSPVYSLSDEGVARSVQKLEAVVSRQTSDAAVIVMGPSVMVLSEKPGVRLDPVAAAAAIRSAYGRVATATLEPVRVAPAVTAAAYAGDAAIAQTMVGLGIELTVKKAKYAPTPDQIGSWLVFAGPGKGVTVDPAGVAAWVASVPGSFDRATAVNAVVAALNARKGAGIAPSTTHPTANPQPASIAAAWPVVNYSYCVDESEASAPAASSEIAAVLGAGGGWTLGGRVHFTRAVSGCDFVLKLAGPEARRALDPECEKQTTCRIHNDLAIAIDSWKAVPAGWTSGIAAYRSELVNHVVGQWLGFDHPNCSAIAAQTPVLSAPSVTIAGCSPKWYAVPFELQDAKVLAGF